MTRSILAVALTIAGLSTFAGQGCGVTGIGDPCVPDEEFKPDFRGFALKESSAESKSYQCQTRLCLVNHFRGRVSCPGGQDRQGAAPPGGKDACKVPGTDSPITADLANPKDPASGSADPKKLKCVPGQCSKRTPDKAVYCSCRCANINGKTDDGGNYCTCPDGFGCEQVVSSIGAGNEGLTGAYCIKAGTKYNENADPCGDPVANSISTCPD
jgi:hypothetical protein